MDSHDDHLRTTTKGEDPEQPKAVPPMVLGTSVIPHPSEEVEEIDSAGDSEFWNDDEESSHPSKVDPYLSTISSRRSRVMSLLEKVSPEEVETIDILMEQYKGREQELIASLEEKAAKLDDDINKYESNASIGIGGHYAKKGIKDEWMDETCNRNSKNGQSDGVENEVKEQAPLLPVKVGASSSDEGPESNYTMQNNDESNLRRQTGIEREESLKFNYLSPATIPKSGGFPGQTTQRDDDEISLNSTFDELDAFVTRKQSM